MDSRARATSCRPCQAAGGLIGRRDRGWDRIAFAVQREATDLQPVAREAGPTGRVAVACLRAARMASGQGGLIFAGVAPDVRVISDGAVAALEVLRPRIAHPPPTRAASISAKPSVGDDEQQLAR